MENVAFIFLIFMGISMYIVAMIILACALKSIEDEIEKYQQRTDVIHHINNSNTKVYNANPRYENEIAIIYNKKLDNADIVYDVQTQFTEYYKYISKRHTLLSVMQTAFKKLITGRERERILLWFLLRLLLMTSFALLYYLYCLSN